jgi:hypothetical protein
VTADSRINSSGQVVQSDETPTRQSASAQTSLFTPANSQARPQVNLNACPAAHTLDAVTFHFQKRCKKQSLKALLHYNAPINVNPEGGGGGRAKGGDLTFLHKKISNATPSGQNSWAKFPTPGMKLYS